MPATQSAPIRIRQRLGKYRIEKLLGEGGFAKVFKAMDTVMGLRVALKIPHAALVDDVLLGSFRKEARIIAKVDHPGILQIKDASVIDGRLVISFPLGKETLSDRICRRMSFEKVMDYSEQLVTAVAFAHERKVVHCDIKPDNVILLDNGELKLADFGIAKVANHTLRGRGTGTLGHMAPEQAMGRPTCASDVFAVALTVYRMLSGQWPEWPYVWPMAGFKNLKGKVSPRLMAWLKKSLEVDPAKRFKDCEQMRRSFVKLRPSALRYAEEQRTRAGKRKADTGKARRTQHSRAA